MYHDIYADGSSQNEMVCPTNIMVDWFACLDFPSPLPKGGIRSIFLRVSMSLNAMGLVALNFQ